MNRDSLEQVVFQDMASPEETANSKKYLERSMASAIDYEDKEIALEIYTVGEKANGFGIIGDLGHFSWFQDYDKARAVIATFARNQSAEGRSGPLLKDGKRNIFCVWYGGKNNGVLLVWDNENGWQYKTEDPGDITIYPGEKIFSPKKKSSR